MHKDIPKVYRDVLYIYKYTFIIHLYIIDSSIDNRLYDSTITQWVPTSYIAHNL